jgi:hypothetical protein
MVLAVKGANFTSPFDPNGSLPATAATGNVTLSTTNANTVVFAGYRQSSAGSPTAGSGFTGISTGGCFSIAEYKVVSSAQASLNMALTTGNGDQNGGIGDAITQ